ncbi:MAG: acylphosphatase [Spartobacteria bacterium]|nr:acylphosphatase [Spartobacteria bacterium]
MSGEWRQVRARYEGDVQGVGFRYVARNLANALGVTGGVENLNDGAVQLVAEGPEDVLKRLLLQIRTSRLGPNIASEITEWRAAQGLSGFYYR